MIPIALLIYVVGFLIAARIAAVRSIRRSTLTGHRRTDEAVFTAVMVGIFWPVIAGMYLVVLPLYGVGRLVTARVAGRP